MKIKGEFEIEPALARTIRCPECPLIDVCDKYKALSCADLWREFFGGKYKVVKEKE